MTQIQPPATDNPLELTICCVGKDNGLQAVQLVKMMVESTPQLQAIVVLTKGPLQVSMLTGVQFYFQKPLFRSSVAMYQFSWLCCLCAEGCSRPGS